ncbi:flavoprotein [Aliikangiella maris]
MSKPRILIGTTGSIDIVKLPEYLNAIKEEIDCHLSVLMTPTALTFFPAETMAIYADRVISGDQPVDWPTDKPSKIVADHDILLVIPTTANTLSTVANGGATNRLTTVILAAEYPVIFFPVMGTSMWNKPAVKRNIKQIREDGYEVVEPTRHEHFDAALQRYVGYPSLPTKKDFLDLINKRLNNLRANT